jgi:hypothetical protein
MNHWDTIARYVRAEKSAGYSGNWERAQRIASHVRRVCCLWAFTHNPY